MSPNVTTVMKAMAKPDVTNPNMRNDSDVTYAENWSVSVQTLGVANTSDSNEGVDHSGICHSEEGEKSNLHTNKTNVTKNSVQIFF